MRTLLILAVIVALSGCAPLSTRPQTEEQKESLRQTLQLQQQRYHLEQILKRNKVSGHH